MTKKIWFKTLITKYENSEIVKIVLTDGLDLFWTSFPDVYLGKACTAKPGHNEVKSIMQFEFAKIYDAISCLFNK